MVLKEEQRQRSCKSTRPFKTVTKKSYYMFEKRYTEINDKHQGCYTEILKKLFEQTYSMFYKYRRVLFVRFDLHLNKYEETNESVSAFVKRLRKRLLRIYRSDFGYLWVRECSQNGNLHYHFVWMIDGDVARKSFVLVQQVKDAWSVNGGTVANAVTGHFIDCMAVLEKALFHGSYLAKVSTKGDRPRQTKDYSSSRLTFKSRFD